MIEAILFAYIGLGMIVVSVSLAYILNYDYVKPISKNIIVRVGLFGALVVVWPVLLWVVLFGPEWKQ